LALTGKKSGVLWDAPCGFWALSWGPGLRQGRLGLGAGLPLPRRAGRPRLPWGPLPGGGAGLASPSRWLRFCPGWPPLFGGCFRWVSRGLLAWPLLESQGLWGFGLLGGPRDLRPGGGALPLPSWVPPRGAFGALAPFASCLVSCFGAWGTPQQVWGASGSTPRRAPRQLRNFFGFCQQLLLCSRRLSCSASSARADASFGLLFAVAGWRDWRSRCYAALCCFGGSCDGRTRSLVVCRSAAVGA